MQFIDDDPSKPRQHKDGANSSIDGLDNEAERIARLPQSIAHLFLYGIRLAILEGAIERAAKLRMPVSDVIISEGFVTEVTFYLSLAQSLELPFCFTPQQVQVEKECRKVLDSGIARFVAAEGELRFMVAPRGAGIPSFISEFAKHRNSRSEKFVFLTTPSNFLESVRRATNQQTIHYTTSYLEQTKPKIGRAHV